MMTLLAANTRAWVVVGGIFLAILVAIVLVDRLFAWLGRNGARVMRNDRAAGGMSGVLGALEGLVRPEKQLVEEERAQRKAEIDETSPSDR